jgi:CheY-specific phosphatase CheX
MPPNLTIVNAFVEPVVQMMQASLGLDARPVGLALTGELDPPPAISVTIETCGGLKGGITWTFSEELARDVAARLLAVPAATVDEQTIAAAAAELANIVVGNATSALLDAGYSVDITPPVVHTKDGERRLANRILAVTLNTGRGTMRVLIDLQEVNDAGR